LKESIVEEKVKYGESVSIGFVMRLKSPAKMSTDSNGKSNVKSSLYQLSLKEAFAGA
jgi:hypothetical protein